MIRNLLLVLATAVPAVAQIPAAADKGGLTPAEPLEVAIEPRASHAFTIALAAGRAYHVEVEQLETYLDVRWKVDAHARRANDRMGRSGREEAFWVADAPGSATLTVGNLTARPGRYRIALVSGEATDADRARHAAELSALKPDLGARRDAALRFGALGLSHREVRILDRLAYLAVAQGDVAAARDAGLRCVSLTRDAGRDEELSSCLLALGIALERAGELDRSYELSLEAIALREALGDPLLVALAVGDSGRVLTLRGDYTGSEAARRRALAISREVGDELSESINEMSLGAIASFRGRTEEALASSERGREVARRRGSREVEAIATLNAGIAYGNLGAIARAIGRIREAIAIAEAEGLKPSWRTRASRWGPSTRKRRISRRPSASSRRASPLRARSTTRRSWRAARRSSAGCWRASAARRRPRPGCARPSTRPASPARASARPGPTSTRARPTSWPAAWTRPRPPWSGPARCSTRWGAWTTKDARCWPGPRSPGRAATSRRPPPVPTRRSPRSSRSARGWRSPTSGRATARYGGRRTTSRWASWWSATASIRGTITWRARSSWPTGRGGARWSRRSRRGAAAAPSRPSWPTPTSARSTASGTCSRR